MPRLATAVYVNALIRRVNQMGGLATLLSKGDEMAGALLLVTLEKGVNTGIWERALTPQGLYQWVPISAQVIENEHEITEICGRRKARDPDLWIVELDIAHAARFAAELDGEG